MENTASLLVDFRVVRCNNCKVIVKDPLATKCEMCGANFDRIQSNHVGLAERLRKQREAAGIK